MTDESALNVPARFVETEFLFLFIYLFSLDSFNMRFVKASYLCPGAVRTRRWSCVTETRLLLSDSIFAFYTYSIRNVPERLRQTKTA